MTGCDQQRVDLSSLQDKLGDLEDSVAAGKKKADQMRIELTHLSEDRSKTEDVITHLRDDVARTRQAAQALTAAFASYRGDYHDHIHKHAAGMALGDLVLGSRVFREVKVKSVDDVVLSFQHHEGFSRVALSDVPQKLQEMFAYDPVLAARAATQEVPVNAGSGPPREPEALTAKSEGDPYAPKTNDAGRSSAAGSSNPNTKVIHYANGVNVEVLGVLGGVGFPKSMGGTGSDTCTTGGSSVTGGKSSLPPGYQPIGSSYSGTAMDKLYKKKDKTHP